MAKVGGPWEVEKQKIRRKNRLKTEQTQENESSIEVDKKKKKMKSTKTNTQATYRGKKQKKCHRGHKRAPNRFGVCWDKGTSNRLLLGFGEASPVVLNSTVTAQQPGPNAMQIASASERAKDATRVIAPARNLQPCQRKARKQMKMSKIHRRKLRYNPTD